MKFNGPLESSVALRVEACNIILHDEKRLQTLQKTGLMDTANEEAFDRLAFLAAKFLKVPLTIISLVSDKKQFFKAGFGLPSPYDSIREIPIEDSICRYTLQNKEIIAADARKDELLKFHPTVEPWGIGSFISVPMRTHDGHVLGAFCAVDDKVKQWSDDDILLLRELTASVMTQIHLRLKINDLEEEKILREKFVTALSHDLRNPLSVAKMGAEILGDSDTSDEERASISKVICENVDRADKMIQDLLTASRVKAGENIPLNREFGDMVQNISSTVESLKNVHKKDFQFETSDQIDGMWDADRIRRIVENLAGNAVKYGSKEGAVTITLKAVGSMVCLSVHNLGNPIPEIEMLNLFNLFERSPSAQQGDQKGWGVGLSVVHALVEDLGGGIEVVSNEREGTTFTVMLPFQ
ncbi:MAG: GAF domain-containing sensor histidine kinase [Oligoflexus sp.]|nr:GAF domain-containing sensor histidine kinase [Oligoflexus sp.]